MPRLIRDNGRQLVWREHPAGTDLRLSDAETILDTEREVSATPYVLSHCSLGHSGLWKPVMAAFSAAGHDCFAPDLPAHGESCAAGEGSSLQLTAVGDIIALLERIGRPAHLVGLSLGGAVMGRVAVARPDLVASVTLIEPIYFHLLTAAGYRAVADSERGEMLELLKMVAQGRVAAATERFMGIWGAASSDQNLDHRQRHYVGQCFKEVLRDYAMVSGFPEGQITPSQIMDIEKPVMLLAGENSPMPARVVVDILEELIEDVVRHDITGAAHLSPRTHVEETIALLRDFTQNCASERASAAA